MTNLGLIERARRMLNAVKHNSYGPCPSQQHYRAKENAAATNHNPIRHAKPIWMETEALVTECQRELTEISAHRSGNATDARPFTVYFTYYAHARTYYDCFSSTEIKARGECFSVFYNALDPKQNAISVSTSENGSALSAIGIVSYILISFLFLIMTQG